MGQLEAQLPKKKKKNDIPGTCTGLDYAIDDGPFKNNLAVKTSII